MRSRKLAENCGYTPNYFEVEECEAGSYCTIELFGVGSKEGDHWECDRLYYSVSEGSEQLQLGLRSCRGVAEEALEAFELGAEDGAGDFGAEIRAGESQMRV